MAREIDLVKKIPSREVIQSELTKAEQRVAVLRAMLAVHTVGDPLDLPPTVPTTPPIPPVPPPPPCSCCFDCTGMAKGTIFYCDGNGGCMALPPPASNAVFKFNLITGTPYWEPEP